MPAEAHTHTHARWYTHTTGTRQYLRAHTRTTQSMPYLHDVELMLQIHLYGSSKCQQREKHTDAPSPRFHTHTQNEVEYYAPNQRFWFKQVPADVHTYTQALRHSYTDVATRA